MRYAYCTLRELNLQLSYDLKIVEAELKERIEREVEAMAA